MIPICIDCWFFATAKVFEGAVVMPAPSMGWRYKPCCECGAPTRFRKRDK